VGLHVQRSARNNGIQPMTAKLNAGRAGQMWQATAGAPGPSQPHRASPASEECSKLLCQGRPYKNTPELRMHMAKYTHKTLRWLIKKRNEKTVLALAAVANASR